MKKITIPVLLAALVPLLMSGCSSTEEAFGAGMSVLIFLCGGFIALIFIFLFVLWIITLVDCIKRKDSEFPGGGENTKTIWLVVLLVTFIVNFWWVACIVYYFMVMKKMPREK